MKAVILAGGLEPAFPKPALRKPMIEIGGKPILWHIMKTSSNHGIYDFIICCGYKGYVIKVLCQLLLASRCYIRHAEQQDEVHEQHAEPWRVTLVILGKTL